MAIKKIIIRNEIFLLFPENLMVLEQVQDFFICNEVREGCGYSKKGLSISNRLRLMHKFFSLLNHFNILVSKYNRSVS